MQLPVSLLVWVACVATTVAFAALEWRIEELTSIVFRPHQIDRSMPSSCIAHWWIEDLTDTIRSTGARSTDRSISSPTNRMATLPVHPRRIFYPSMGDNDIAITTWWPISEAHRPQDSPCSSRIGMTLPKKSSQNGVVRAEFKKSPVPRFFTQEFVCLSCR